MIRKGVKGCEMLEGLQLPETCVLCCGGDLDDSIALLKQNQPALGGLSTDYHTDHVLY